MIELNSMAMISEEELNVGENLKTIRSQREYSLRVLAEKSGLSVNTLSLIEKGKSSPSVSTLQRLASALNVPIADFFSAESNKREVVLTKKKSRTKLMAGKVNIEIIGKGFENKNFQQYVVNFKPGDGSGSLSVVHLGLESIFVLSGSVEFTIGEAVYPLSSEDHIIFDSNIPHHWRTIGDSEGRMLITFFTTDDLVSRNFFQNA